MAKRSGQASEITPRETICGECERATKFCSIIAGREKAVIGIAKVVRGAYPDSTATEGDWSAVDLAPSKSLRRSVTLREIKSAPQLKEIPLIRQSRLSVMPVTATEFRATVRMGE